MAIDPITGIASGIVGGTARAVQNAKSEQKLNQIMKEHSDTMLLGTMHQYEEARRRAGEGTPLGWMWVGSDGGMKDYFTKEEYLWEITYGHRVMTYDSDFAGWNKEWGDCKIECAKARRAYYAKQNPKNAIQILGSSLKEYEFKVKHKETYVEMCARKKAEADKAKEEEIKFFTIAIILNLPWIILIINAIITG